MKEQFPKIYLYKRVVQAKLFIDRHYAEQIDLGSIAHEAFFSKFHFIRVFKSIYGETPRHYLRRVRIEQAKLLLQQNRSVTDVCYSIGFDSVTSFADLFKKITGNSPSFYREQYRIRINNINAQPLRFIPGCFANQNGWSKKSNSEEVPPG